jgi:hypothetical protein
MKEPLTNPGKIKPDNSGMHVLIPFAVCRDPAAQQMLSSLRLPHLAQLLTHLSPQALDVADEASPTLPHERVLARALGLPQGPQIPLAAWQAGASGHAGLEANGVAWTFITPCHWNLGQAQITLDPPQALALNETESRALLRAMQPYFEEDGITLVYDTPARWLAHGEVFRTLVSASPERVVGRGDIKPWMPAAPTLRRLQNEMQMLLYTHPVNEARAERGAYPVNSFWVSGSGALATPISETTLPLMPLQLMEAALQQDWHAWGQAWKTLDATVCADVLRAMEQGGPPECAILTLCGERSAQTYTAAPQSFLQKMRHLFGPKPMNHLHNKL